MLFDGGFVFGVVLIFCLIGALLISVYCGSCLLLAFFGCYFSCDLLLTCLW